MAHVFGGDRKEKPETLRERLDRIKKYMEDFDHRMVQPPETTVSASGNHVSVRLPSK